MRRKSRVPITLVCIEEEGGGGGGGGGDSDAARDLKITVTIDQ